MSTNVSIDMTSRITLTPAEVAAQYGLSERQLRRYRGDGSGPAYSRPTSRTILYRREDIEAWLDEHRVAG